MDKALSEGLEKLGVTLPAGAKEGPSTPVSVNSLLFGVKPIQGG